MDGFSASSSSAWATECGRWCNRVPAHFCDKHILFLGSARMILEKFFGLSLRWWNSSYPNQQKVPCVAIVLETVFQPHASLLSRVNKFRTGHLMSANIQVFFLHIVQWVIHYHQSQMDKIRSNRSYEHSGRKYLFGYKKIYDQYGGFLKRLAVAYRCYKEGPGYWPCYRFFHGAIFLGFLFRRLMIVLFIHSEHLY